MNRYEQCGCVSPYLWNAHAFVLPGTNQTIFASLCNKNDLCYKRSVSVLLGSASLLAKYCADCQEQCLTNDFIVQTSFLAIALEWQKHDIEQFMSESNMSLPNNWSTTWRKHIKQNYLTLSVIRETDIVESNTQTAALTPVNIISNVGGHTGLWIGVSFLSMMELVEMIYRLLRYKWRMIRRKRRTTIQ